MAYGVFTVALIYLFFSLFVQRIPITEQTVVVFIINVLILAGLHSLTCNAIHRNGEQQLKQEQVNEVIYLYTN